MLDITAYAQCRFATGFHAKNERASAGWMLVFTYHIVIYIFEDVFNIVASTFMALFYRSVSCVGNSTTTECRMSCIRDYVAIERNPYACTSAPCKAWELGESTCYMCDQVKKSLKVFVSEI